MFLASMKFKAGAEGSTHQTLVYPNLSHNISQLTEEAQLPVSRADNRVVGTQKTVNAAEYCCYKSFIKRSSSNANLTKKNMVKCMHVHDTYFPYVPAHSG